MFLKHRTIQAVQAKLGDPITATFEYEDCVIVVAGWVTDLNPEDETFHMGEMTISRVNGDIVQRGHHLPIPQGRIITADQATEGLRVEVVFQYGSATESITGVVGEIEPTGFWVGGTWVSTNPTHDENGIHRTLTIRAIRAH